MKMSDRFKALIQSGSNSPTAYAQDLHMDVIRYVVKRLSETNMSKKELAEKIGVKESQISRILNADGNLTMLTVGKLFWAFKEKPEIVSKKIEPGFFYVRAIKRKGKELYAKNNFGLSEVKNIYGT